MSVPKKNWLSELFIATAFAAFVWLFLFAGAYNAITSKPPKERSQSQQTIVRVMSVLDDGDESLYLPRDIRYTAVLLGVPLILVAFGTYLRLRSRK